MEAIDCEILAERGVEIGRVNIGRGEGDIRDRAGQPDVCCACGVAIPVGEAAIGRVPGCALIASPESTRRRWRRTHRHKFIRAIESKRKCVCAWRCAEGETSNEV